MNYERNRFRRFYHTNKIIIDNAHYALPLLIHSFRSSNDRRFVNTRTIKQCENNPSEIGYLLKNIPQEELSLLHLYTVDDLKLTYGGLYDMGIGMYERYAINAKRPTGRWGLENPIKVIF